MAFIKTQNCSTCRWFRQDECMKEPLTVHKQPEDYCSHWEDGRSYRGYGSHAGDKALTLGELKQIGKAIDYWEDAVETTKDPLRCIANSVEAARLVREYSHSSFTDAYGRSQPGYPVYAMQAGAYAVLYLLDKNDLIDIDEAAQVLVKKNEESS